MKKLLLTILALTMNSLYCQHEQELINKLVSIKNRLFDLNQLLLHYEKPKKFKKIKDYSIVGNTDLKNKDYNTISITGNTTMTNVTGNTVHITGNTQLDDVFFKKATITGNLTANNSGFNTLSLAGSGDFIGCIVHKKIIIEISQYSGEYIFNIGNNTIINRFNSSSRKNFNLSFENSSINELEVINKGNFKEQIIYLRNNAHIKTITAHNINVEIKSDSTSKVGMLEEFYD